MLSSFLPLTEFYSSRFSSKDKHYCLAFLLYSTQVLLKSLILGEEKKDVISFWEKNGDIICVHRIFVCPSLICICYALRVFEIFKLIFVIFVSGKKCYHYTISAIQLRICEKFCCSSFLATDVVSGG